MKDRSIGYRIFTAVNTLFVSFCAIICVLPMVHILAVAFSGKAAASANLVNLWPIDFTANAFTETLNNQNFIRSLINSTIRVIAGEVVFLIITTLTAYPLSKQSSSFKSRNRYIWFFVFTMLFSGGLVPNYILIMNLRLNNTLGALILPGAVNVWSIIMLLNFFRGLPKELEEAAYCDGAGEAVTLLRIYIPVSLPSLATLSLFTMVNHWNSWFDGMIYMSDVRKFPLATLLQTIIVQQDFSKITLHPEDLADISDRTVKAAQIFIGALPILSVYPFLQKYFVKGIVLGAVKG